MKYDKPHTDEKTPHIKLRYAARRKVAKIQMKFVKQCIDDAPQNYTMLDTMYNYFKQYGALKGEAKKVLRLVDSPEVKAKAKEFAQWFDTSSTLITILEEYNDKYPQINFASETARLHLAEYLIEKIKVRNKEK